MIAPMAGQHDHAGDAGTRRGVSRSGRRKKGRRGRRGGVEEGDRWWRRGDDVDCGVEASRSSSDTVRIAWSKRSDASKSQYQGRQDQYSAENRTALLSPLSILIFILFTHCSFSFFFTCNPIINVKLPLVQNYLDWLSKNYILSLEILS